MPKEENTTLSTDSQFGRRLSILLLTVTPILLLISSSLLFRLKRSGAEAKIIESYIQSGSIDLSYRDTVLEMANRFVKGSRFEGRVNATQPPTQGDLNIYMLGSDPLNAFTDIKCNCAYIGENIILCDRAFFETFASSVDYYTDQFPILNKVNKTFNRSLGSWLLGHEIGHAVLHGEKPPLFSKMFARPQDWQLKETQADEFVISHIDSEELQKVNFSLMNLVFQIYSRAYAVQQPKNAAPIKIKEPSDRIHGPWVQRALKMSAQVEAYTSHGKPGSDALQSLSSNFVYSNDGYDVGLLCDGVKIRGPNN